MSPRRARAVHDRVGQTPADALHAHLIEVAEQLLAHRSPSSITTREVARAAGVSDGVLYNYFDDKHGLLLTALQRRLGALTERFSADVPEPGSATVEANLEQICLSHAAVQADLLPTMAGLMAEPALLSRLIAGIHPEAGGPPDFHRRVVEYLDGERKLGRVAPEIDLTAAASLVIGSGLLLALAEHLGPAFAPSGPLLDRADRASDLVATLMRGIAPRAPVNQANGATTRTTQTNRATETNQRQEINHG